MRIRACGAAAMLVAGIAPAAMAFDASIRIGVNKGQRIVVSAGDQFRVEALLTYPAWQGPGTSWVQFAGTNGSIIVSRDVGTPGDSVFSFYTQGGLVNFGTFRGGSRMNLRFAVTPTFYSGGFIIPQIPQVDGLLAGYDLSIDVPGKYTIAWSPETEWSGIYVFPSVTSAAIVHTDATYYEADILVVACRPDLTTVSTPGVEGYGVPDGVVDSQDFFYYLQQYQIGNVAIADMTTTATPGAAGYRVPDGLVTGDDYFYFLSEYARGC